MQAMRRAETADECGVRIYQIGGGSVFFDFDQNGYTPPGQSEPNGCVRENWLAALLGLDCNDHGPSLNAALSDLRDWDREGYISQYDCDDHDRDRHPGALELCNGVDHDCDGPIDDADAPLPIDFQVFGIDSDLDRCPTEFVVRGVSPGGPYVPTLGTIDCAPDDALVHPQQPDDCEHARDVNCDGVFSPVYGGGAEFTATGSADPPTLALYPYGADVVLCPGTYRAAIGVDAVGGVWGSFGPVSTRGVGATPADVVLDASGVFPNAIIRAYINLDQGRRCRARSRTSRLPQGVGDHRGCIDGLSSNFTLDNVIFSGCTAN